MTNEQYYWYVLRRNMLHAYATHNLHMVTAAGGSDDTAPTSTPTLETDTKDDTDKAVFVADLVDPETAKTELTEDNGPSAESPEITVEDNN